MFKGDALEDTFTVKHYGIKADAVMCVFTVAW